MELYPKAKVFNSFNLKVSELHSIFVEESGNQNGKPVIFLHVVQEEELVQLIDNILILKNGE